MLLPLLLTLASSSAPAADSSVVPVVLAPDAFPATWTIALQTSGDMRAVASAAREPIARLVESLPEGDLIEILVVHTRSSPALPLRTIDNAGRAALAAEVRALELPSAKSTDLGAALTAVAASITAAGADSSRLVLLVGSFCHAPPLESIYADGGFGCRTVRGFDKLDLSFDQGGDRGTVEATLFPVGSIGEPVHQPGVEEVSAFFAPAASVEVATEPFAAWVDAVRERLPNARLRPLARADAARLRLAVTVEQQPTTDAPTGTLLLDSGLRLLGFEASRITLIGARTDAQVVHLAPTGSLPFSVDIPPPPFSFVPRNDTVDIPVTLRLDGALQPPATSPPHTLEALGIAPGRPTLEAQVVVRAQRHYGLSPARSLGMGASVLLFASAGLLGLRRRLRPLRLGGSFSYRRAGGPRQALAIDQLAEAHLVVLPDGSLGHGRREDALLVLRAERPLWNTHITAEIRSENAEINARPVMRGRHTVVPGATSFQFQDYRLSWE
ncbi:MAG: hypothetical protein Q8P18_29050 [Pseudomonadota bacterium]|nr:hypothetical protein [Pseudomonadota bacterium]